MEAADNERMDLLEEETKDKVLKDLFKKETMLEDLYEEARKIKNDMEASDNERRQMELGKHNKESKVMDLEEEETKDKVLKAPNNGYGVDLDDYSWIQSLREVVVIVPLPPGPEAKQVKCRMQSNHLLLGFGDQPPIIDGELYKSIILNGSFWITEEKHVGIHLVKHDDQMELWKCLVKGDLEIDSQKVEAESSKLLDLDPKGQSTMLKMLLGEQLKSMGLPMPKLVEMFSKSLAEQYPTLLKLAAKKNNHTS